jgi:CRP-like cAMP-binding protein
MHILLKKLTSLHDISEEEQAALLAALTPTHAVMRGEDIVPDGSTPKHITVLLSGTACRYKILRKAQRHIYTFRYPGDMIDLYSYVMNLVDHAIGALSDCEVAHSRRACALPRGDRSCSIDAPYYASVSTADPKADTGWESAIERQSELGSRSGLARCVN